MSSKKDHHDLRLLLTLGSRPIVDEIREILEQHGIPSLMQSDNPASSVLSMYAGPNVIEKISVWINDNDFDKATELLKEANYDDLLQSED